MDSDKFTYEPGDLELVTPGKGPPLIPADKPLPGEHRVPVVHIYPDAEGQDPGIGRGRPDDGEDRRG